MIFFNKNVLSLTFSFSFSFALYYSRRSILSLLLILRLTRSRCLSGAAAVQTREDVRQSGRTERCVRVERHELLLRELRAECRCRPQVASGRLVLPYPFGALCVTALIMFTGTRASKRLHNSKDIHISQMTQSEWRTLFAVYEAALRVRLTRDAPAASAQTDR